jgi:hypothetical protein
MRMQQCLVLFSLDPFEIHSIEKDALQLVPWIGSGFVISFQLVFVVGVPGQFRLTSRTDFFFSLLATMQRAYRYTVLVVS